MPTKDSEKLKAKHARYDAKRVGRTRNFATVVYPDSAPADWKEKLDALHVAVLISPLHDKDVNPSGEPKKPHYHVLVMFEGVKDFETQVKPIFDEIGAVGRENVNSARGYARYLCHLDNPEKAPYSPSEVVSMGGADFYAVTNLPTDDLKMLGEVFMFIREQGIYSLAELMDLTQLHHPEWFSMIAMSRCYVIDKYIKSLEWERSTGYIRVSEKKKIDKETGEIIEPE